LLLKSTTDYNLELLEKKGVHYYPSLGSTNVKLRRLAEEGAPEGAVVLADSQSAGRGRRGRTWHSPPGKGLYFSLLLRPQQMGTAAAAALTLVAAVSTARLLRESSGAAVTIKWPNDLLVNTKKLGGILTEAKSEGTMLRYLLLGIGLNLNHEIDDFPVELRGRATSLALEYGHTLERTPFFLSLRENLLEDCRLFFKKGFAPFRQPWKEMSATLGRTVEVALPGKMLRGKAVDIGSTGALLIEDERGEYNRILCGEII
jgi:BirA family biotin operon repressor/biotin-[acetyl-CoA-carboxylase] ligase